MVSTRNIHESSYIITDEIAKQISETSTEGRIYVSPSAQKWAVRKSGNMRATRLYKHKASAINAARRISKNPNEIKITVFDSHGQVSKMITK